MQVYPSETCPLQSDQVTPVPCMCSEHCASEADCQLEHHVVSAGNYKVVISGLFGLHETLLKVRAKMPPDVVKPVTLMMSFCSEDTCLDDDIQDALQEIQTMKTITERVDPRGEFTPRYIAHYCKWGEDEWKEYYTVTENGRIRHKTYTLPPPAWADEDFIITEEQHQEFHQMHQQIENTDVPRSWKPQKQKLLRFLSQHSVFDGSTKPYQQRYIFLYLEDAGEALDRYLVMTPQHYTDLVHATFELLENYSKLTAHGICNLDLHSQNILCMRDASTAGRLRLKMIDFGFNQSPEDEHDTIYDFVLNSMLDESLDGGRWVLRCWHPVYYYLFHMAFELVQALLHNGHPLDTALPGLKKWPAELSLAKHNHAWKDNDVWQRLTQEFRHMFSPEELRSLWAKTCDFTVDIVQRAAKFPEGRTAKLAFGDLTRVHYVDMQACFKQFQAQLYGPDSTESGYRAKFDRFSICSVLLQKLAKATFETGVDTDALKHQLRGEYIPAYFQAEAADSVACRALQQENERLREKIKVEEKRKSDAMAALDFAVSCYGILVEDQLPVYFEEEAGVARALAESHGKNLRSVERTVKMLKQ